MKSILSSMVLVCLVSCGANKTKTVMVESPFDNSNNEERLTDLENKVAAIELNIQTNITTMGTFNSSLQSLESRINSLNDELEQSNSDETEALQNLIDTNTGAYNSLSALIASLQGQVNSNVSQLVVLQNQNNVVEYLDPCGDYANHYDELILKTSNGDYLAYFEIGSNRFLTKLIRNTQYQTTDQQGCSFKIDNNGNLV